MRESTSRYFNERIGLVVYSSDMREYMRNVLCLLGNPDKVFKIVHHRELNRVDVLVDSSSVGFVVGKGCEPHTEKEAVPV